jgi:hypothetical protein
MSTASWTGVEQIARSRLLTFTPTGGGSTLAVRLGSIATGSGSDGKLFLNRAPDNLTGLWAVFRIIDAPVTGFDGGFMIKATAELIVYGRPASAMASVESCVDVACEAWHGYLYTESGGHFSTLDPTNRFAIPYAGPPTDRELCAVRVLLPFRCTPIFLTRYAAA